MELVADDLERGTLIRVLQRYSLRMDGLYLYYPHRNVSPALRAVIDTLFRDKENGRNTPSFIWKI